MYRDKWTEEELMKFLEELEFKSEYDYFRKPWVEGGLTYKMENCILWFSTEESHNEWWDRFDKAIQEKVNGK